MLIHIRDGSLYCYGAEITINRVAQEAYIPFNISELTLIYISSATDCVAVAFSPHQLLFLACLTTVEHFWVI